MKKVLVTGGSRGIGEECVREFSLRGYKVYFFYKTSEKEAELISKETGATAIRCDVSNIEDVINSKKIIGEDIDIIINNAGISQIKMFQDITDEDWDNVFNTNIKGIFNVTKTFIEGMIKNKYGRIINISSMWGETGASCEVHYSASKAAVIGFTKALAKELGPSGITVNCVSPGLIKTDMNNSLSNEDIKEIEEETPIGRIGDVKEVVSAIMYFSSENAGFTTGTVLPVNGGLVI